MTKQVLKDSELTYIRSFDKEDIPLIVDCFAKFDWHKPKETFENYLHEQAQSERLVWLAFYGEQFAGYVTLKWLSYYEPFQQQNIPEIMDLNVLPPYRNKGIGSLLLETAEKIAATRSKDVGLGVGLYHDYGNAQKLYIKRGYILDGRGVTYQYQPVQPGSSAAVDDDLVLWFTKKIPFPVHPSLDDGFENKIACLNPTQEDIPGMVNLSLNKRLAYEKAQPQFWRHAAHAEEEQHIWFNKLLQQDDHILLIAKDNKELVGFIIGQIHTAPPVYDPKGLTLIVDDFCVKEPALWCIVGLLLTQKIKVLAQEKGAVQWVFVAGAHDTPKQEFLNMLGLRIASEWYVGGID